MESNVSTFEEIHCNCVTINSKDIHQKLFYEQNQLFRHVQYPDLFLELGEFTAHNQGIRLIGQYLDTLGIFYLNLNLNLKWNLRLKINKKMMDEEKDYGRTKKPSAILHITQRAQDRGIST